MFRGGDDQAILYPTIATGTNGIEGFMGFWHNSTVEVKNLMMNECDVIYECRYCRNLFRSIINFIAHKRSYCRGRFESLSAHMAVAEFANNALASGSLSNSSNSNGEKGKGEHQSKRAKGILKRANIIGALNKRIEHYALALPDSDNVMTLHTLPRISRPIPTTTFENGEQVIETMPRGIAAKESLPPERVPLVIPQDYSYRYREMNLRYRRNDSARQDVPREVGFEEIAVMDRLCKYVSPLIELASMSCLHSDCKEKRPFSSIFTLAYHVTVKHNRRWLPDKHIPCFLCDSGFSTYETVMAHLKEDHYNYYKEHCVARAKQDDEKTESKRGRKPKSTYKVSNGRFRSLSPMSEDFVETDESIGGEESDRDHDDEEEEEGDIDNADYVIREERDGESDHDSEMSSHPQSLSSINIDVDAASPEWGLEPPHLSPEIENEEIDETDFEIRTAVEDIVTCLISTVVENDDLLKTDKAQKEAKVQENQIAGTTMPILTRCVSRVEGYEMRENHRYFFVKWRGMKKRSWVSEENLKDDLRAKSLIKRFIKVTSTKPVVTRGNVIRGNEPKGVVLGNEPVHENVPKDDHELQISPSLAVSEGTSSTKVNITRKTKIKLHYQRQIKQRLSDSKATDEKEANGEDEDDKEETEKKRGKRRGRKGGVVIKNTSKSPENIKDDTIVHSDDADEAPKVRPSRHRRKPNWIDDANFVTAFQKKRSRQSAPNEVDVNADESVGRPSVNASKSFEAVELQQQGQRSELLEEGTSDPTCLPPVTSLPESTDISPSALFPEAPILSNEGSSSRQPSPEVVLPSDENPRILDREKDRLYRSLSPRPRSNSPASIGPHSVVSDPGVVLPASFIHPVHRYGSECSARMATPKTLKKEKELTDSRFLYTPRARKMKFGDDDLRTEYDEDHDENTASSSTTSSHSRRKQNLSKIHENDNITIVRLANGRAPPRPEDLSEIPVYLTEMQRDLFFSFIRPASTSTEGVQKCMQCGKIVANMMEGRRHAVSHLRIMRLRCSLCDCGSFFCSDMRTHLQYRHCPKLLLAPRGYVLPGDVVPCMTQRQADELTKLVDPQKPGRVMYTSGKIVSSANPAPYYPDPEIEKRVLGSLQPATFGTPQQKASASNQPSSGGDKITKS